MLFLSGYSLLAATLKFATFYLGSEQDARSLSLDHGTTFHPKIITPDSELAGIGETLFVLDRNATGEFHINLQNQTRKGSKQDVAQERLFVDNPEINWKTIALIKKMYDNYNPNVTETDPDAQDQAQEENELLDAIIDTPVMQKAHEFLFNKSKAPETLEEFKEQLRVIWFTPYSRASGVMGSSGFEHVFLGELKKKAPIGIHSWIFYRKEEYEGRMNYLGYIKEVNLGKAKLIEMPVSWYGTFKPISSIFVGTTPELEMALYTICFRLRHNGRCPLTVEGENIFIQTYSIKENGVHLVATAYPFLEK